MSEKINIGKGLSEISVSIFIVGCLAILVYFFTTTKSDFQYCYDQSLERRKDCLKELKEINLSRFEIRHK